MKYYAGIDIGGTKVKMGIVDETGKIHYLKQVDTEKEYEQLLTSMTEFVNGYTEHKIEGVGIATPGIVTEDGYMQTSGAIKCFLHKHMQTELTQRFGLTVILENDSKCAAAGEKWVGAAKSLSNFVCLTLGTAVGAAIYQNGVLWRGLGGLAGEFGVVLASLTDCDYEEASYSYHAATVAGLCRSYSMQVKERILDAQEIYRRKENGDSIAEACIQQFYHACATLFVNIACMLAPEVILIGGGISQRSEAIQGMQKAYEEIIQHYHVLSLVEMPKLQVCTCRNHAGILGAVYNFLQRTNTI